MGSGPAGLAAAADLVRYGADVTIYEALHVVGGVLRYGIPSFRLPRDIIDREVNRLKDMGVKIETNKVVGKTFTVAQLMQEKGFDSVFLGVGAGAPTFLGIPGEFAGQVYSANEFLTRVNLMGGDRFPYLDTPVNVGQSVVVIGAGNTAMDCLRVSKRIGAATVRCVYRRTEAEAPARIEEIRHAKEEGIDFFFLHAPVEIYVDAEGNVKGMKVEEMELGDPDEKGRRKPVPTGRFKDLACDTVIYALGTKANPIITQATPGLGLNKWGNVVADDKAQATTLPGVFAGGDIVTGGATVILAMGAGRRAAKGIATWLAGGKSKWPVAEADLDAFVPMKPIAAGAAAETSAPKGAASVNSAGKTCPKCRQPLEGDEEYICCANSKLQWRCESCAKVSEGFAFPYGQCPACGGKLAPLGERSIADAKALEAVRIAFEIELGGMAFYKRAAAEAKDPDAPDPLRQVRRDGEGAHGHALRPLPRGRGRGLGGLQDRACGRLRRHPQRPAGPGQPLPHRHRVRAAGGEVLLGEGRRLRAGLDGAAALQGAGRRGAGARRHPHHRVQPLQGGQAGDAVAAPGIGSMLPRAVLFDLDGTLIDSIPLIVSSMKHAFEGHPNAPRVAEWVALIGTPLDAMIRRWAGDEADVERVKERYKEHQWAHHDAMVRAFPGVPELLDALTARGVRMAVVTSKLEPSARRSLDFLGLSRHFELVVGLEATGAAQARPGAGAVRARPARGPAGRGRVRGGLAARRPSPETPPGWPPWPRSGGRSRREDLAPARPRPGRKGSGTCSASWKS